MGTMWSEWVNEWDERKRKRRASISKTQNHVMLMGWKAKRNEKRNKANEAFIWFSNTQIEKCMWSWYDEIKFPFFSPFQSRRRLPHAMFAEALSTDEHKSRKHRQNINVWRAVVKMRSYFEDSKCFSRRKKIESIRTKNEKALLGIQRRITVKRREKKGSNEI